LAAHEALVRELIAEAPDQTLDELWDRLAKHGVVVGRTSVHRYVSALGLTRKKRHSTPPSKTAPTSRPRGRHGATSSQA
jgi:transposase